MTDHSDYSKPRTDLLKLLPEVYQSGVNESLLETTLNRFLTKSELRRVIGFIGQGNPNVLVNRQIQEPTPHRQAYQLQPILYNKIGTIEHMSSWQDIQAELERLGVDLSRMKEWGKAPSFNWAPPIDYDKLLNYRDYYWYNPGNIADQPQYVTIQDPCARVEAKLDEYQNTLNEFGDEHTIVGLDAGNKTFTIEEDLVAIFTEGFVFYVKNSTNSTINNEFFTTVSSQLDLSGNTVITVDVSGSPPFSDATVDGIVSLSELSTIFESERDCACNGTLGWSGGQWDDNQIGDVLWNTALISNIQHSTEASWIAANGTGSPPGPSENDIWYDDTADQLKQYGGSPLGWIVVQEDFSVILAATTGGELWDLSTGCGVEFNTWIEQNKWIHKNQVPNFTLAKQAQIPIIEFLPSISLNKWAETSFVWNYRASPITDEFAATTSSPHLFELDGVDTYTVGKANSPQETYFIFDSKYGDMSSIFVTGYQFRLSGSATLINNLTYTVVHSTYCEEVSGEKYQTRVTVSEDYDIDATGSPNVFDGTFIPLTTSLGDDFDGLHRHWLFLGVEESKPVSSQPLNPMLPIPLNPPPASQDFVGSGSPATVYGDYVLSLYAQEATITSDSFGEIGIVSPDLGSPNGWLLNGDHTTMFNDSAFDVIGRKLVVQGNTGGGVDGEYTIISATLSAGNTLVEVSEEVPAAATSTGTAYVQWVLNFDSILHNQTRINTNELRIYIDDIRQFGVYDEINANSAGSPQYIGSPERLNDCDDYVNSVVMKTPVAKFGKIRIEVGAATSVDIGYENVFVRTDPNNLTFNPTTDLECASLVRFRKLEQVKTITNQYPLFDIFDVEGNSVNIASRVFGFYESQDAPVDPFFGKRIVHEQGRREYSYEQFLLDEDDGPIYAYRETSASTAFWFDTDNSVFYHWTGSEWDQRILTSAFATSALSAPCYVKPIISDDTPGEPWISIDGMIWFNTNNNSVNVSDGSSWSVDALLTAGTTISAADPTVCSIWRTGIDDTVCEEREVYVPSYVDGDRNEVPIGDPTGDWEIPHQLYFNHLHENRKVLKSSELLAHFGSIVESQEIPPGFFGSSQQLFHIVTEIDFGKGGVIKEYNNSYDTFLSSVFIQNVNPLQLYEFAHDAYENALNQIKELFRRDVQSLMTDTSEEAIADLSGDLANDLIDTYEQNDFSNLVFGDSNTFDQDTGLGVRNWPATLPFTRMAFKVEPQVLRDELLELNELRHHDGHLSNISFASTSINAFNQRIITTPDDRTSNPSGAWGTQSVSAPPTTFSAYETQFGKSAGCYWYEVTASSRILYRMEAVRISGTTSPPSTTLPIGSFWYDTTADRLKVLSEVGSPALTQWVNATTAAGLLVGTSPGSPGTTVSAWTEINLDYLLSDVLLELETRLYQAAPDLTELAYDIDTLVSNNQVLADELYQVAFFEFISQAGIQFPFDNPGFDSLDPFTWNYKSSVPLGSPSITDVPYVSGGTWQDVYQKRYGTPYPHLEPWKLQGYNSKPTWWDTTYADTTGTRRWLPLMWTNIFSGTVPSGELLPDGNLSLGFAGTVQTYNFVSVNIDSLSWGGVDPDELLPPFWEAPTVPPPSTVRSVFTSAVEIIAEDADFQYDDAGVVEWTWENATQYLYDSLKVAFKIDPVRFIHQTLGEEFIEVGCLEVSKRQEKVYAHQNTQFHGDLLDDNSVLKFPGTLQWYTNYNRFNGYDGASSNFRAMWTAWRAPLGYQFSTFVDTESFLISNRNFDITDQDYRIRIKRSPGIEDHWMDALRARLISAPPSLLRVDSESQWVFDLNSYTTVGRPLKHYATKSFPFTVNIAGSPEAVTNVMTINDPYARDLPWVDGDAVVVSSDQFLPSPLMADVVYYVTKVSNTEFSLSEVRGGPVVTILSGGVGNHTVSQVARSFRALDGTSTDKIWYAYELDKDLVLTKLLPERITGMQNIISIVFGYDAYQQDVENFRFNHEATDIDFDTGRVVNWQLEVERFINFAYNSRTIIQRRHDSYKYTVEGSPLAFKFETITSLTAQGETIETVNSPNWRTGKLVTVTAQTGSTLPDPLLPNTHYYIIRDSNADFRLALTSKNARNGVSIPITSTGSGELIIQEVLGRETSPEHELNPFRNNLWISTPQGVVADLFRGPFADVKTDQLLFDQNGNRLPGNKVLPLRQDKITRIMVGNDITNDVNPDFRPVGVAPDMYNLLHLSSAHVFIDGYEHVLLFNNYASNGALIYDPFLGLNTPKFDVQYDRSPEFTLRPNVGGYTLLNQQDVDFSSKLIRNMEGQTEDLRFAYDTYKVIEANDLVEEGRDSLGYDGPFDFLNAININPKSQFLFWRGMIQAKGSVNSIKAFINSRRFVDAKIDEFWSYKIADYGSSSEYNLPEIKLFTDDTRVGEIRLHFVDEVGSAEEGFLEVNTTDQSRWYEYPNQQEYFDTVGNIYFNTKVEIFTPVSSDYKPDTTSGSPATFILELPQIVDGVIVRNTSTDTTLAEGVDYDVLNSKAIIFLTAGIPTDLSIYMLTPYESKHNPCKIRDTIEELTISDVILWHPALNNHYHNAIHLVDVQRDDDPVTMTQLSGSPEALVNRYEFQVNTSTGDVEEVFADSYDPWGRTEVGTTWLDTNELGFVPYSDKTINPDILDRLKFWGRLADWSSYRMYQWTESDVAPDGYNALAEAQEGDVSIDEQIRVTGRIRTEVWQSTTSGSPEVTTWALVPLTKLEYPSHLCIDMPAFVLDQHTNNPDAVYDVYKNGELALDGNGDPITLNVNDIVNDSVAYEVVHTVESFDTLVIEGDQSTKFSIGDVVDWFDGPNDGLRTILAPGATYIPPSGSPRTLPFEGRTQFNVTPLLDTTTIGGFVRNETTRMILLH